MKNPEVLKEMEKTKATEKVAIINGVEVKVRVFPIVKDDPAFYQQREAILSKVKRKSF